MKKIAVFFGIYFGLFSSLFGITEASVPSLSCNLDTGSTQSWTKLTLKKPIVANSTQETISYDVIERWIDGKKYGWNWSAATNSSSLVSELTLFQTTNLLKLLPRATNVFACKPNGDAISQTQLSLKIAFSDPRYGEQDGYYLKKMCEGPGRISETECRFVIAIPKMTLYETNAFKQTNTYSICYAYFKQPNNTGLRAFLLSSAQKQTLTAVNNARWLGLNSNSYSSLTQNNRCYVMQDNRNGDLVNVINMVQGIPLIRRNFLDETIKYQDLTETGFIGAIYAHKQADGSWKWDDDDVTLIIEAYRKDPSKPYDCTAGAGQEVAYSIMYNQNPTTCAPDEPTDPDDYPDLPDPINKEFYLPATIVEKLTYPIKLKAPSGSTIEKIAFSYTDISGVERDLSVNFVLAQTFDESKDIQSQLNSTQNKYTRNNLSSFSVPNDMQNFSLNTGYLHLYNLKIPNDGTINNYKKIKIKTNNSNGSVYTYNLEARPHRFIYTGRITSNVTEFNNKKNITEYEKPLNNMGKAFLTANEPNSQYPLTAGMKVYYGSGSFDSEFGGYDKIAALKSTNGIAAVTSDNDLKVSSIYVAYKGNAHGTLKSYISQDSLKSLSLSDDEIDELNNLSQEVSVFADFDRDISISKVYSNKHSNGSPYIEYDQYGLTYLEMIDDTYLTKVAPDGTRLCKPNSSEDLILQDEDTRNIGLVGCDIALKSIDNNGKLINGSPYHFFMPFSIEVDALVNNDFVLFEDIASPKYHKFAQGALLETAVKALNAKGQVITLLDNKYLNMLEKDPLVSSMKHSVPADEYGKLYTTAINFNIAQNEVFENNSDVKTNSYEVKFFNPFGYNKKLFDGSVNTLNQTYQKSNIQFFNYNSSGSFVTPHSYLRYNKGILVGDTNILAFNIQSKKDGINFRKKPRNPFVFDISNYLSFNFIKPAYTTTTNNTIIVDNIEIGGKKWEMKDGKIEIPSNDGELKGQVKVKPTDVFNKTGIPVFYYGGYYIPQETVIKGDFDKLPITAEVKASFGVYCNNECLKSANYNKYYKKHISLVPVNYNYEGQRTELRDWYLLKSYDIQEIGSNIYLAQQYSKNKMKNDGKFAIDVYLNCEHGNGKTTDKEHCVLKTDDKGTDITGTQNITFIVDKPGITEYQMMAIPFNTNAHVLSKNAPLSYWWWKDSNMNTYFATSIAPALQMDKAIGKSFSDDKNTWFNGGIGSYDISKVPTYMIPFKVRFEIKENKKGESSWRGYGTQGEVQGIKSTNKSANQPQRIQY